MSKSARPLLLPMALAAGCLLPPPLCAQDQPLVKADGTVFTCARAEDCPRPTNVVVCTSTIDQVNDCVACERTVCVRYSRGECSR